MTPENFHEFIDRMISNLRADHNMIADSFATTEHTPQVDWDLVELHHAIAHLTTCLYTTQRNYNNKLNANPPF